MKARRFIIPSRGQLTADQPFELLMSLHGCDYFPEEPRLGIHYQLLSLKRTDRLGVKTRVSVDDPNVRSVVDLFPGAVANERRLLTAVLALTVAIGVPAAWVIVRPALGVGG